MRRSTSPATRGLVGSAIVRRLRGATGSRTSSPPRAQQLDLRDQAEVTHWFKANRPEYVFLVAGTVGGILANSTRPAEFIYDNMMIHGTVVHAAHLYDVHQAAVPRLVVHLPARGDAADHRGRSCSPGRSSRPTSRTRSPRSPASSCARRTASSTAATSSRRCRPTSTARTTTSTSPVEPRAAGADPQVPRRQGAAARPTSRSGAPGAPMREFLHVDDLADACLFLMEHYSDDSHINVGTGDRPVDPRARRDGPRHRLPRGRAARSTRPSPTARRASCSTSPARATSAGHRRSTSTPASATTYQWFLDQQAAHADLRGIDQPVAVGSGTS